MPKEEKAAVKDMLDAIEACFDRVPEAVAAASPVIAALTAPLEADAEDYPEVRAARPAHG